MTPDALVPLTWAAAAPVLPQSWRGAKFSDAAAVRMPTRRPCGAAPGNKPGPAMVCRVASGPQHFSSLLFSNAAAARKADALACRERHGHVMACHASSGPERHMGIAG